MFEKTRLSEAETVKYLQIYRKIQPVLQKSIPDDRIINKNINKNKEIV